MNKLARISYNSKGWKQPIGEAKETEAKFSGMRHIRVSRIEFNEGSSLKLVGPILCFGQFRNHPVITNHHAPA